PSITQLSTLSLHDALPIFTPAPRGRLLIGKILAVTTISLAAAVASITSMLIALSQISFGFGNGQDQHVILSPLAATVMLWLALLDRKSTRLNSSHQIISYA